MFERDGRPGGHTNTVCVELGEEAHEVDTGFIVYNERNYPGLVRLFDRLGVATQPSARWRTVEGGARTYVERILAPLGDRVRLATPVAKVIRRPGGGELLTDRYGLERFDHVILATHGDESLKLLGDATEAERGVPGNIRYQPNTAVLHTDGRLLPRNARLGRAGITGWRTRGGPGGAGATVAYHMNRLQSIDSRHQICVTLNQKLAVDPGKVLGVFQYAHPVLDAAAVAAQQRHDEINGLHSTWYCGAYWGYGFHEDGVQSASRVCRAFGADL